MGIDPNTFETRLVDRIVMHGGGHVQPDHVRCVFAVLRSFFTRVAHAPIAAGEGQINRFLVGAHGDLIAVIALEMEFTREDTLNLVTWMALIGGFSAEELAAARTAAVQEE